MASSQLLLSLPLLLHLLMVVLLPLMIVAGDHAAHDMAGDDENSWKRIFKRTGYDTVCVLRGLGERPAIRWMIMGHCAETMKA